MKKSIIILLILVLSFCELFAVIPGGIAVFDASSVAQAILQRVSDFEQYAKTAVQWEKEIKHFQDQYRQVAEYFKQLKGAVETIKDTKFLDIFNKSNELFAKCTEIAGKANGIYKQGKETIKETKDTCVEINKIVFGSNANEGTFAARIKKLEEKQKNLIPYSEQTIKTAQGKAKEVLEKNKNELISIEKEKIKVYNEQLKEEIQPALEKGKSVLNSLSEKLNTVVSTKEVLENSINLLKQDCEQTAKTMISTIKNREHNQKTVDDLKGFVESVGIQRAGLEAERDKLNETIKEFKDNIEDLSNIGINGKSLIEDINAKIENCKQEIKRCGGSV